MDTLTLIMLSQQEPERAVEYVQPRPDETPSTKSFMFHAQCLAALVDGFQVQMPGGTHSRITARRRGLGRHCYHCNGLIP